MSWAGPVVWILAPALLTLAQLGILVPAVAWLAAARALTPRLPIGLRLLLAVPLTMCVLFVTTAAFQPLGFALHPVSAWTPAVAIAVLIRRFLGPVPDVAIDRDRWSLAPWVMAALVAGFLLSAGVIPGPGQSRGQEQRLGLLAISEDSASHLAIYDTMYDVGGFAYVAKARARSAQWPYPPGFHLLAVELRSALEHTAGTNKHRGGRFDALWLASILAFGFMIASACVVADTTARRLGAPQVIPRLIAVASAGVLIWFWSPFSLFLTGYSPQLVALGLLGALACAAIAAGSIHPRVSVGLYAAIMIAIAWTWYFLVPIAGLLVACALWVNRQRLKGRSGEILVAGGVTLGASALPVYQSLRTAGSGILNAAGGGNPQELGTVAAPAVLALGLLVALGQDTGDRRDARRTAAAFLAVSVGFSLAMRQYQIATTGVTAYFFDKSLYTLSVFGVAVLAGVGAVLIERLGAGWRKGIPAMVLLVLAGFMITDARPNVPRLAGPWTYRDGKLTSSLQSTFAHLIAIEDEIEGRYMVVWENNIGSPIRDYGEARWMNAFNDHSEQFVFNYYYDTVGEQRIKVLAEFVDDRDGNVAVFTKNKSLRSSLIRAGAPPRDVERILINP